MTRYLHFIAKGCIAEKYTDCDGVLLIGDLVICERVIEVLTGFGVFEAIDDYLKYVMLL